jgi:enediyne biosynthesis protein E4
MKIRSARLSLPVLIGLAAAAVGCSGESGPPVFGGVPDAQPAFVEIGRELGFTVPQGERKSPPDCLFNPQVIATRFPKVVPPSSAIETTRQCDPERSSAGAAAVDVNGDGLDDLVVTRIYDHPLLYVNESTPGKPAFRDATTGSGLDELTLSTNGAGFADIDRDGDQDVFLTTLAADQAYLLVNDGTGVFTEEAVTRGAGMVDGFPHAGFGVTFGDYDNDGWVDLHTNEWQPADVARYNQPSHSRLLRNLGATGKPGFFEDVTNESGASIESRIDLVYSFASSLTDFDGDGWPDLTVIADFDTTRFFWNNGDGTFTESTYESNLGGEENGMGLAVGFWGEDPKPSMFITSIRANPGCDDEGETLRTGNRLYVYDGDRMFRDVTDLTGMRNSLWGWGTTTLDATNAGKRDYVSASGMVISWNAGQYCYADNPFRYWVADAEGVHTDVAETIGMGETKPTKGTVAFDADRDGRTDLFVTRDAETPLFFHNVTPNVGAWLDVRVTGRKSDINGAGAIVSVKVTPTSPVQKSFVGTIGSFLTADSRFVRFGLGQVTGLVHEVRVDFPATGKSVVLNDVEPNMVVDVEEPE